MGVDSKVRGGLLGAVLAAPTARLESVEAELRCAGAMWFFGLMLTSPAAMPCLGTAIIRD